MTAELGGLQRAIWEGSIPLEIRLAGAECRTFDDSDPYMIQYPRLTYLPFLLPRLHAFFASALIDPSSAPSDGWFECDGVPLKWHYPVGLLYDLYAGAEPFSQEAGDKNQDGLPWRLVVHFSDWPDESLVKPDAEGKTVHDAFVNSVKEADFLRNGTAKAVMSLSKEDSTNLWQSVESHSFALFNSVNQKLLSHHGSTLRHVPLKFYLPTAAPGDAPQTAGADDKPPSPGSVRVVQAPIAPALANRQSQTLGTALNGLLPTLFPSRRSVVHAQPVLHGAVVPLTAELRDLGRAASYTDGWLHVVVRVLY